ncbi:MAG TPA: hypothetical protein PLR41_19250, partial [Alphaproteobacteria bacterium]|nr:hypothetical protein [Alphaproteobacteria bacterium]
MTHPARPEHRVLRWILALTAGACASLLGRAALADDPVCDYTIRVLDRAASRIEVSADCDPVLKVAKFTALSDRGHWTTDPAEYGSGKGHFTFDLGAFAA